MITLDLIPNTPEWISYRSKCFTASEASAMMGQSKYQTRDALLKLKSTGIAENIDANKQRLFDLGHATEAAMRPIAEEIIGEELFPVVGYLEVEGLPLLASFDGLTMDETIAFEHKLANAELLNSMPNIGPHYYWQLEQQLLVSGADTVLFICSDGTTQNMESMCYSSIPERRRELINGWKQFAKDLAEYVPKLEAEKVVADPVESLPSINYKIDFSNGISVKSDLDGFKVAALELVERSKTILVTDQDFENAKERVKACKKAESNIDSLIERVLGELGDVNKFKTDLESIQKWISQSRLNQSKQIDNRTVVRKKEILDFGRAAIAKHITDLNKLLVRVTMPTVQFDLDKPLYKKSSFSSMESAMNDAIAQFKIDANLRYEEVAENLALIDKLAADRMELFRDIQLLCVKDKDSIEAIIKNRISEYEAKEKARIEEEAKRIADAKIAEEADRVAAEAKRVAESEKVETPAFVGNQDFAPTASNDEPVVRPAARRGYEGYAPTAAAPNKIFTATADDFINIIAMHFLCDAEVAETRILKAFKEYLTV